MVTKEYLQTLTRPELSQYCRDHGIKGYSGKTKADRITLILNYEKSGKQPVKRSIKKTTTRISKDEAFKIRKVILKQLYYSLFLNTKNISDMLKISMNDAYKHMRWLEKHNLVYGEADSGTGISTGRGAYRTRSIIWEPAYAEERGDEWIKIENKLRKEMNYHKSGKQPVKKKSFKEQVYKTYKKHTSMKGESMFIDTLEKELNDSDTFNKLWDLSTYGHANVHLIVGRDTGKHKMYLKYGRGYTKLYIF